MAFHAIQRRRGGYDVIARSTGKSLGHHRTRASALAQLRAVERHIHAANAARRMKRNPSGRLTIAEVRKQLAVVGISIRREDGEYRVNFRGGKESTAYYTNDLRDALGTGLRMAREVTGLQDTQSNPPLMVFGNPPEECFSENVVEIRYQHKADGKFYCHTFKRGQVHLSSRAGSEIAVLHRVDGKPIVGEY